MNIKYIYCMNIGDILKKDELISIRLNSNKYTFGYELLYNNEPMILHP